MDDSLHETFWAWALNRYEARALRDCLLALQDSSGLVVIQALLYAWLALQLELEAEKALAKLLCDCLTPPHSGSVPIPVGSNLCLITALSAPDDLDSLIAAFGQ